MSEGIAGNVDFLASLYVTHSVAHNLVDIYVVFMSVGLV